MLIESFRTGTIGFNSAMTPNKMILCFFLCLSWTSLSSQTITNEDDLIKNSSESRQFAQLYKENFRKIVPSIGDIGNFFFREKCLKDLGCFYNGPPFYHPLLRPISLLPFDLKDMKTKFYLYTSRNERTLLEPTKESLANSPYNKNLGLRIFVHGFKMTFTDGILALTENIIGAMLKADYTNLILVDWTSANQDPYPQAVANARVVGAQVAQLVNFLRDATQLDPNNVHIVGHSLGAHASGFAGKRIKNLGRITGLDPAGPYFQFGDPVIRLDKTDANFVDVMHTNAADVVLQGLGIVQQIGHIDFYPNGGIFQPGCEKPSLNFTLLGIDISVAGYKADFLTILCNHVRTLEFFIESADNSKCKFIATECPDYQKYNWGKCASSKTAEMGLFATKDSSITPGSSFYLTTSDKKPYCKQ